MSWVEKIQGAVEQTDRSVTELAFEYGYETAEAVIRLLSLQILKV